MALEWDAVEKIRAAQTRRDTDIIPGTSDNDRATSSPAGSAARIPALSDIESMIFKIRAQLIDYIVAHGLVDGLIFDGTLRATESGKIVITSEMIDVVTDALGYYKESDVLAFVEQYLPDHHYVADADYIHTDNNYDDDAVDKLDSIEYGAEVNKIIGLIFNGNTVVDPDTRVATITITPEMIKEWYESNDDTNAFTDDAKQELATLWERLDYLDAKVDDVRLDGESIVKDKIAYLTALKIKNSYESNPDTNAYTDAAKAIVESIPALRTRVELDEQRIDALERAVARLQSDLAQEITDRETGDKNLHTEITVEASARAEADNELRTLITEESLARARADQALEEEIINLGEDLGRTKENVTALANDIAFERNVETESSYNPRQTVTELWLDRVGESGEPKSKAYARTAIEDDVEDVNDGNCVVNKNYVKAAVAAVKTDIPIVHGNFNALTNLSDDCLMGFFCYAENVKIHYEYGACTAFGDLLRIVTEMDWNEDIQFLNYDVAGYEIVGTLYPWTYPVTFMTKDGEEIDLTNAQLNEGVSQTVGASLYWDTRESYHDPARIDLFFYLSDQAQMEKMTAEGTVQKDFVGRAHFVGFVKPIDPTRKEV